MVPIAALTMHDATPRRFDNAPSAGAFPDEGKIKMPFKWSPNVRWSSMGGSFAFVKVKPKTKGSTYKLLPLSPNILHYPPIPSQHNTPPITHQYAPNIPPIHISIYAGGMGLGLWALRDIGGASGGYWRCRRGIGGVIGMSMAR